MIVANKQFITELSPEECLDRIVARKSVKPPYSANPLKQKYKSFFIDKKKRDGIHIYSDVKGNKFVIYINSWIAGRNAVEGRRPSLYKKFEQLTGTVNGNESGGAVIEYQMNPGTTFPIQLFCWAVVVSIVCFTVIYIPVWLWSWAAPPLTAFGYPIWYVYSCRKNLQNFLKDLLEAKDELMV